MSRIHHAPPFGTHSPLWTVPPYQKVENETLRGEEDQGGEYRHGDDGEQVCDVCSTKCVFFASRVCWTAQWPAGCGYEENVHSLMNVKSRFTNNDDCDMRMNPEYYIGEGMKQKRSVPDVF